MRIVVTGGAGFIGSALVRHVILNTDHEIVNVDSLTYAGNLNNLKVIESSPKYKFVNANICELGQLIEIFTECRPDAVIHLAAESHVDQSITGPLAFMSTNIIGTFNLLEATRRYLLLCPDSYIQDFRFMHVSTDEVYGDLPHPDQHQDANEYHFSEQSPYRPNSPYAASKASSDHLVRAWGKTYGIPVVITNCSNNYGPYQYPEKLIPLTIINALKGKKLPVYGSGQQIRDWLYVDDHITALLAVLTRGKAGTTYNIGARTELRNIEVVKMICSLLQQSDVIRPPKIGLFSELIEFVEDRLGHDQRYAINPTKIERELNWSPAFSFDEGLRKTVDWYVSNATWWQH
jgi:dTDP-glucose 4,6-dehydratase